jgi:hypothetical protein
MSRLTQNLGRWCRSIANRVRGGARTKGTVVESRPIDPYWWSARDRLAARLGARFWPALYIASRRTRNRWGAVAHVMAVTPDWEQPVAVARLLERDGIVPPGTTEELEAWRGVYHR